MDSKRILVVDDSTTITSVLCRRLLEYDMDVVVANNFKEAIKLVETGNKYFLALLDLNLPDAANGEVVGYMLSNNIPSVVMTGNYHEKQRLSYSEKPIIDYVLKDSPWSLKYIVKLANRIYQNQSISILVVDDSGTIRRSYRRLLEIHKYNVIEAVDGKDALNKLKEYSGEIKLIITDYNMPQMDGFGLVAKVRQKFTKEEIAIIGLSAESDRSVSAKFLKLGANDFLSKSFIKEEFYARVTQNIDSLELIEHLKDIAMKDHLTGLYNRRYFFSVAEKLIKSAKKEGLAAFVGMIDIDHFKKVNDVYGHQVGDIVLVDFSAQLKKVIGSLLSNYAIARFGGEEFIVISIDSADNNNFIEAFEVLRKDVEATVKTVEDVDVRYTISMGISLANESRTLDEMIKNADDSLYVAKNNGRNRIVIN